MVERTIERMGSIELEEFGLEVEREHHSLILHDSSSSSFRPALNGNDATSSSSSQRIVGALPSREQISILVRNANTKPSPLVRLGLTYRSGGMVRLSLVLVLLALAVLLSLRQENDETTNLEAHLSNVYIIGNAGIILPFAKCTTSSQCEVKGYTSSNNINACECYATSSIQDFDECEGVSTKDYCHLHTCYSKMNCNAYNVHCELYKTENGNDKSVGECKILNNSNNNITSENENVDLNNVDEDDVNEVESSTTDKIYAAAEVGTTMNDDGIEVEKEEKIDKEAELNKEEEVDEKQIIDNDEGLETAEIESKEPDKVESLVTENRDEHDEVEVKGGKITKKSTPDETHQGSEHVSEGKIAASPDLPISPPRRDDYPTPSDNEDAEDEEDEDDENSDISKEEGESHKRIDDDDDGVEDNTNEEGNDSMI